MELKERKTYKRRQKYKRNSFFPSSFPFNLFSSFLFSKIKTITFFFFSPFLSLLQYEKATKKNLFLFSFTNIKIKKKNFLFSFFQDLQKQKFKNQNIKDQLKNIKKLELKNKYLLIFSFFSFFCFYFLFSSFCRDLSKRPVSSIYFSEPDFRSKDKFYQHFVLRSKNPGPTTRSTIPEFVLKPPFPTRQPAIFSFELHEGPAPPLKPQPQFKDFDFVYYFDGGAGKLLNSSASGIVVLDVARLTTQSHARYLHGHTNNTCEAIGILGVLRKVQMNKGKSLILGDSELILRQLIGLNSVDNDVLRPIIAEARNIYAEIPPNDIVLGRIDGHHGREPNLADKLCTECQFKRKSHDEDCLLFELAPPEPKAKPQGTSTHHEKPFDALPDDVSWDLVRTWNVESTFCTTWAFAGSSERRISHGKVIRREPDKLRLRAVYAKEGPNGEDVETHFPPPKRNGIFIYAVQPVTVVEIRNPPISIAERAETIVTEIFEDNDYESIPTHTAIDPSFEVLCTSAFRRLIGSYPH